jgi:hypothetical protein
MPSTRRVPLNTFGSVVLDGSGNGIVTLGPRIGQRWNVLTAAVSIPNAVKIPQANIYIGGSASPGNLVDGTFTGNLDSTSKTANYQIPQQESIIAQWIGGDPGATATLSITGIMTYG